MNLVDSCGWLEYFGDGPNATFFASPLKKPNEIIVPTICLYEVFKKVLAERDEDSALQAIAAMRQGLVVCLDSMISLSAAKISHVAKVPMADAIILATAKKYAAQIWTQDEHLADCKNVRYKKKSR